MNDETIKKDSDESLSKLSLAGTTESNTSVNIPTETSNSDETEPNPLLQKDNPPLNNVNTIIPNLGGLTSSDM